MRRAPDGQWPPLRQHNFRTPHYCRGEHCSSAMHRYPTGDNGNYRFCTRVMFHIAANFHRRTANGRPYGLLFFAERSFRQWQSPKTSAGHNRAVAIEKRTILMRIGRLPRPSIARPLLAGGTIRFSASNSRYSRYPTGNNGSGFSQTDGQWPPLRSVILRRTII